MKKIIRLAAIILFVLCFASALAINSYASDEFFEIIEAPITPTRPNVADEEALVSVTVPEISVEVISADTDDEELPKEPETVIEDEEIPLSEIPKTGDRALSLVPVLAVLGAALTLLGRYMMKENR